MNIVPHKKKRTAALVRRNAQFFIDRGFDAKGNEIMCPDAYMNAAMKTVGQTERPVKQKQLILGR